MTERNFELKVGIFTFIGIVILFIIIFSIGELYFFKPGYNIRVVFGFANGIAGAAPVRVAGVEAGEVKDINIFYDKLDNKSKVEILIWLREHVKIELDATAHINTLGLLGEKYLEIMPKNESLWEGDCFVFDYRVAVNHDLKPALWKIDPVTNLPERMNPLEVDKIAERRRSGAIFKKPYTF